jgi:hypothetical protein
MRLLLTAIFAIYLCSAGFSQKFILENYNPRENEVIKSTQITYYGVDFSKLRLTEAKQVSKDLLLKKYFSAWLGFLEKKYRPEYYVKKLLQKENFSYSPSDVQNRISLVPEKWVELGDYSFNIDTVKSVVASYHLQKKDGIGFVIIVENFNDRNNNLTEYCTFFDIASKEVLWSAKVAGHPSGIGMTKYWGNGVFDAFKKYLYNLYFLELKKDRKEKQVD